MFSATDMKRTCPDAFARFVAYDKVWRDLMLQMSLFMHATACLSVPDLEDALGRLEGEGAALQEALGAYLAAKRRACARLYFLSDGQLLDLLREVRGYVGYERCEVSNLTLSNAYILRRRARAGCWQCKTTCRSCSPSNACSALSSRPSTSSHMAAVRIRLS